MALFSVSALVSVVVILAASVMGIGAIYTDNVLEIAKQRSVSISRALLTQERDLLTGGAGEDARALRVGAQDFPLLDRRMHDYLQPFDIVEIKIFGTDTECVYSTDPTIVGKVDRENARLAAST